MNLQDRVAVVTGGGSGIGLASKSALERRGAKAVAWDVVGGDVHCDVRSLESIREAMRSTVELYGVPSLLVASAGVGKVGSIVDLSIDEWDLTYDVNVRGVFLSLEAVVREMTSSGLDGSVVLISSVNSMLADPAHSMYSTSKAAVSHLARCAAVELGPQGIRVNAAAVGPTETPMMTAALESPGYRERIAETTPLGRVGDVDEVAEEIVSILAPTWVTGQVIALDGGASLVSPRGADRAARLKSEST